ncbi:hypothetical protein NDU88_009112 [Pleurodeles waltl]|uniref:Uncharacterized protein n=1 Tax=Pleurodeles waltl TaxID=8319 RepID=A0AAV7QQR7_PLEWA|nr:hypothetical protein NDU88_009112 [Pleurodeles waltl]
MRSGKLRVNPDGGRTRPPKGAKHFHPVNSPVVCLISSGIEGTHPTEQREPNLAPSSMSSAEKVEYKITDFLSIELSRLQENKVPIDLADAVTVINSEKDLLLGSHSFTQQEPERLAFGKEISKVEPDRPDCSGSILDLDFSVWEDSLPSFQARKETDLLDLGGTPDHPLIELIDTDFLEGDTSTEQGKTIHPHESSQKHEADMLRTIISLSPFQDSTRNSQLQSDVPANTWGTLLSTLDVMATVIKHQADKQDIQVDLLNVMAKYIVVIDSKLQALNDLIQRAQKQNYIQQVACDCAISGDNSQTIFPILNDILAEVRAQALSTRERLWGSF